MKIIVEFNDDINIDDINDYIEELELTDGIKKVEIMVCNNCNCED